MEKTARQARTAIPRVASLATDPDRIEQMWAMTPQERLQAAEQGQLSLGEMLRWASRRPSEVPLVDGEFFFITALSADAAAAAEEPARDAQAFWDGEYTPLPQAPQQPPVAAGENSRGRR